MSDQVNSNNPPLPPPPPPIPTHHSNNPFLGLLNRDKLTGYLDWNRALRIALRYEDKEDVIDVKEDRRTRRKHRGMEECSPEKATTQRRISTDRVTKLNIRKIFEPFGKVVDIYIAGKRDRTGSIFTFVRFVNVRDAKALEEGMARVRCEHFILKVNITRYQKQEKNVGNRNGYRNIHTYKPPPPPTSTTQIAGKKYIEATPKKITIEVKRAAAWLGWNGRILTGEMLNAQLISSIPMLLKLDGNVSGRIYYVGGLKILIKFIKEKDAEAFLAEDSNWNRWFSWLKKGYREESEFQRITWINIWGVPTRFMSDTNYARIANSFGKVIETYGNWDAIDISTGHVCILTKSTKMINEEVTIKHNDVSYKVGVVEFDRDWSPFDAMEGEHHWFKHPEEEEMEGDDDTNSENSADSIDPHEDQKSNNDEEEGISNTEVRMNTQSLLQDETIEEGEIVEETPNVSVESPACNIPTHAPATTTHADEVMDEATSVPEINNTPTHVTAVIPTDPNSNCVMSDLEIQAQTNFGPVPIPNVPLPGGDEWPETPELAQNIPTSPKFGKGELHDKRRRVLNPTHTNQFESLQRNLDLENWPLLPNASTKTVNRTPRNTPLLDLNRTAASSSIGHSTTTPNEDEDTISNEISSMLLVDKNVGFQVTREYPIMQELVGRGGKDLA
ncbi:hypothetical protein LXL04_015222 [Taraxacum kok-saghyz]